MKTYNTKLLILTSSRAYTRDTSSPSSTDTPATRCTRKLSYRKDDRAMRPMYENCRESLTTPTATFPEIFNGLLFRLSLQMCTQNLQFVALPVPEIIGGTRKIWAVPGYAHAPFSPKILMGFCSDGPSECTVQI